MRSAEPDAEPDRDPDPDPAIDLMRGLRAGGETLSVVMTRPHSAFRTTVDLARLEVTDFLERPLSALQHVVRPPGQSVPI